MNKYLLRVVLFICLTIAFYASVKAQKVSPNKITADNARRYRDSLKLKIFGTIAFPYSILPDSVITRVDTIEHYPDFPYTPIMYPAGNLDSIDKFVITVADNTVDFPEKLKVYLFHPHNSNGKLFIYHSGHCAGVATSEDIVANGKGVGPGLVIPALIEKGYTVLAVPTINYNAPIPIGYNCGYNRHDELFSDGHYTYPMALFFNPLIASLNQLGRQNFSDIYMTGLSGGGWMTSIYPAIDSSISMSFPVAGSWPIPVRYVYYPSIGDGEQTYPPIFNDLLDYHEIYSLACLAPARKMLQINNRYDACCFAGAEPHIFYVDTVAKALNGSGGEFRFYLDETDTGHQVTPRALNIIFTYIDNQTGFLQEKPADTITNGMFYSYDIKNNFRVNTIPDNSILKFSLLKSPGWLSLDTLTGIISGIAGNGSIFAWQDSISFKVEDSTGRFVLYNYNLVHKRVEPIVFTKFNDSTTVYILPHYSASMDGIDPGSRDYFYFNNPGISVLSMGIENNSVIRLNLSRPLTTTDSIGYNGYGSTFPVRYRNGIRLDDFNLKPIQLNAVKRNYATAGMIRFNTDTGKFEYFNGHDWVDMH